MRFVTLAAAFGLMTASFAAQAATISIHGSTTVSNAVLVPHKSDIEKASGEELDIVPNGSGRGLVDLVGGKADMAMISAAMEEEVAKINEKTPGAIDASALRAHQIGEARVAFVVNSANSVKTLTLAQVTDILNGTTKNWSEIGGADQPIIVVAAVVGDGVRSTVEGKLLAGKLISGQLREVPNANQIAQVVSQIPGAFGVMAAASEHDTVSLLKTDTAVGQPLILVTMGEPNADAAKVVEAAKAAATAE
jgi:phosphate transport system substrate-binding protein